MDRTLNGKVALVTGAGPGIGRSTALALARDGADVVVAARRPAPLEVLAREIAAETGRRSLAVPSDLMDLEASAALVDRTIAEFGRLDVLVNVATASFFRGKLVDNDWSTYGDSVQMNIVGTMKLCADAARVMAAQGGGSIINIGTLATTALQPQNGEYSSTKLAMVGLSKTMAREMGGKNVRVNVVTPGYTTGEPLEKLFEEMGTHAGVSGAEMSERVAKGVALKRHIDPDDIAEACVYLGSDRARNVTGVELHVTAGAMIV